MESNRLFLIENEKVLNFAFENKRDLCQRQSSCVNFSTLDVTDLVVADTGLNSKLILRYAMVKPQLAEPFTQPASESILLFRGHRSKLPLSAVPNSPIYRVILFLFYLYGMGTIISLGWDVGGYTTNNNAFVLATMQDGAFDSIVLQTCTNDCKSKSKRNIGNDLKLKDDTGYYSFPHELFAGSKKVVIAIDAPFGFPSALLRFFDNKEDNSKVYLESWDEGNAEMFAFRETDLDVKKNYYPDLLSPVFSNLGRCTFRAIRQLTKWKMCYPEEFQVLPWHIDTKKKFTAIEVYPALLKGKLEGKFELYSLFANLYGPALKSFELFHSFERLYDPIIREKEKKRKSEKSYDPSVMSS